MAFDERDIAYMRMAIEYAARGWGLVSPNPPVGCVIVNGDEIVGEGWHEKYGQAHAEVNALNKAGEKSVGATAYVTLMPCSHLGKTPPCTAALIEAGVKRVVVACDDPNPDSGDGKQHLRDAGVEVEVFPKNSESAREAADVMRGFLKYVETGLPFVTLKMAMTLDGKSATGAGDSKWISCDESRDTVQLMRGMTDAVMVGGGTAAVDDPRLNVRQKNMSQPKRVIIDEKLKIVPGARIFKEAGGEVVILTNKEAPAEKARALSNAGATVVRIDSSDNPPFVDLEEALQTLAATGVRNLLCEGGSTLAGALLDAELIDEVAFFIAPKVVGGSEAKPVIGGKGAGMIAEGYDVRDMTVEMIGNDLCVIGRIGKWRFDK